MQVGGKNDLNWISQEIQIHPLDYKLIESRSQIFTVNGMNDEAIADCTKLIYINPTREVYQKRSKLYRQKGKYSQAIQDLREAQQLKKQSKDETAFDLFLTNSVCMKSIRDVQQMASLIETEATENIDYVRYENTLRELLQVKQLNKQIEQQKNKEIQQIKQQYKQQVSKMEYLMNEFKKLIKHNSVNYESKFDQQLEEMKLKTIQKQKLKLYFGVVSSQMEKYYVAAKNLHKIQDKTIKFQDFQGMVVNKKTDFMVKVYKFFDKYSSKIQKIEELIKNIPYIGTAFNIIKSSMKAKGWVQEINIQNQCHNIERVAINITNFNEFSSNIAYYLVKHYQEIIVGPQIQHKSMWEQLKLKIKKVKQQQLGEDRYKHNMSAEEVMVQDYAIIHASIIMVAYACNHLNFTNQKLKQANKAYEKGQILGCNTIMGQLYEVIDNVEEILKTKTVGNLDVKIQINGEKTSCNIY